MSTGAQTRPSLLIRIRDPANSPAWEDFVRIYTPLIHGYCRQRELQDADAADVAQEVMRSVMTAIRRFEYDPQVGSFRGWLLTVARNKVNNLLGASERRPQAATDTTLVERIETQSLAAEEARWDQDYHQRLFRWASERVRQEVRPATWQAFCLTAMENRSAEEAASATGLTVGGVYVARSRVTARLRELFSQVADDPPDLAPSLRACPVA